LSVTASVAVPHTRPTACTAMIVTRRYRDEFYMTEIPAVVQRFVFALLMLAGRALGKYEKYTDAPEPVRR